MSTLRASNSPPEGSAAENPWVRAGRSAREANPPQEFALEQIFPLEDPRAERVPDRLVLVGAHAHAGTTTWAHVLEGTDSGVTFPEPAEKQQVWLVGRKSAAGIAAVKAVISAHRDQLAGVLLVAAGPGSAAKAVQHEAHTLTGVVRVITIDWVKDLLAVLPDHVEPRHAPPKLVRRLRTELSLDEITTEGDRS